MGIDDHPRPQPDWPTNPAPPNYPEPEYPQHEYPEPDDPRADELSAQRIRQIATLRRAAYRSRSHAIIAAVVAFVMACQLVFVTYEHLHDARLLFAPTTAALAVALFITTIWLINLAMRLHHQAQPPPPADPTTPPDFTPLSDGSQRWKNLEKIE